MSSKLNRRTFIKKSLLSSAAGALALRAGAGGVAAQGAAATEAASKDALPKGKIGNLSISRLLLGGNLLTHYTHSRDLSYVYNLTAHYNTDDKIHETMALAEAHGVNTVSIHTAARVMDILKKYRYDLGGKINWIICSTNHVDADPAAYRKHVQELVADGTEAIYLWGVVSDRLVAEGKVDMIARAVAIAKECGVPSGVGAHDLKVIVECEKQKVDADFYIKTFHHHNYPTGPKPEEIKSPYSEFPGYWCSNPQQVIDFMKDVGKPWIAFKVMAAGAIPPQDAFKYVFENGADYVLAGMFDFEIAEDVRIANDVLSKVSRVRPWRS